MSYLEGKQKRNEDLLRAVGHLPQEEPAPESEDKPDFDGGARETVPLPSNPERDHDNLLYELLAAKRHEGPW